MDACNPSSLVEWKRPCLTCRKSKVRCDRGEPACGRCTRLGLPCIEQEPGKRALPPCRTSKNVLFDPTVCRPSSPRNQPNHSGAALAYRGGRCKSASVINSSGSATSGVRRSPPQKRASVNKHFKGPPPSSWEDYHHLDVRKISSESLDSVCTSSSSASSTSTDDESEQPITPLYSASSADSPLQVIVATFNRLHNQASLASNKSLLVLRAFAQNVVQEHLEALAFRVSEMCRSLGLEWKALLSDSKILADLYFLTREESSQDRSWDPQYFDSYLKDLHQDISASLALISLDGRARFVSNLLFSHVFGITADTLNAALTANNSTVFDLLGRLIDQDDFGDFFGAIAEMLFRSPSLKTETSTVIKVSDGLQLLARRDQRLAFLRMRNLVAEGGAFLGFVFSFQLLPPCRYIEANPPRQGVRCSRGDQVDAKMGNVGPKQSSDRVSPVQLLSHSKISGHIVPVGDSTDSLCSYTTSETSSTASITALRDSLHPLPPSVDRAISLQLPVPRVVVRKLEPDAIPTLTETGPSYAESSYSDNWPGDWAGSVLPTEVEEGLMMIEAEATADVSALGMKRPLSPGCASFGLDEEQHGTLDLPIMMEGFPVDL